MIGSAIAEETGWNIVVENKPGAGGNLALDATACAQPDGHTLVMAQTDNIVLNPWLYNKLSYDTFKDFKPVGPVASSPSLFVVLPESPYQSIADVVKTAKAKPNFISLGMPGVGGTGDLTGYLWRQAAGIELMHRAVSRLGTGLSRPGQQPHRHVRGLGGHAAVADPWRQGPRVGVVATDRSPALPDVPTFVDSGYPTINQFIWWA